MKFSKILIALLVLSSFAVNITSCASDVQAADLMKDISSTQVNGKSTDDTFNTSMANFSIELFKNSITEKENSLVSPLSVMLALAMTANGADNETLVQMEKLLGEEITLNDLNEYLYAYVKGLPNKENSKLSIANSIWFRNDNNRLRVEDLFLQKNADYYNAYAYKSAFDAQIVQEINDWVTENTDGMIDKIIDEINDDVMLYLINAVVFDAEWQEVYNEYNIQESDFTDINGKTQKVDFMHSNESKYLDDGKATGFMKPYAGNHYSFAALLPNEDISIETYIESLTGSSFINTIKNAADTTVYASMPKFEYEYEIKMNEALKILGMSDAFDSVKANFKRMAKSKDNIYIGEVLHKTYISVDELGTKAGAVTKVEMLAGSAAPLDPKNVRLDRPFVYAIIDNATNLPIFIGTVMSLG